MLLLEESPGVLVCMVLPVVVSGVSCACGGTCGVLLVLGAGGVTVTVVSNIG